MSDTPLHVFETKIRGRLSCVTQMDAPLVHSGIWYLDVTVEDKHIVVQHYPGKYTLGISVNTEETGYGEGVDEIFSDVDIAVERAVALLR